ncbi:hypothetical protein [Nocardioides solisilvae]|uniref:hypothetical protein n=1 Tax=Nocardioides solisilvae TaxID=1542435 RepID=UPI000D742E2D|nr:hypothetical protein [Nocardioides solisilvae]
MSAPVVHLHIGAPKTGTTYLQDRLTRNAATLARHGVTFPSKNRFIPADLFQFRAALDLLEQEWGGRPGHMDGAWEQLVRKVHRAKGPVIVSHEILAAAKSDKIAKAMNDLDGVEVHVVYSARDLARQLPAAWQETIKQGRRWTYRRFLTKMERGDIWFAKAFDLPRVLERWGARIPPERVHLVTVPHGRAGDVLWHRFAEAFGIDPAWAPLDSERANRSLGVAEVQLLRKLNRRLGLDLRTEPTYDVLVRQMLAQGELANRESQPVTLPPDRYDWVEAQADEWIRWVAESGIHVVGDVEDLRPRRPDPTEEWVNPDKVRARPQLAVAMDALTAMTHEAAARADQQGVTDLVRTRAQQLLGK